MFSVDVLCTSMMFQRCLREEVKEIFNYEVDRSPSDRINDFVGWTDDIVYGILYSRKVSKYRIGAALMRSW